MIRSIAQPKGEEELDQLLDGLGRVFIVGCGTCVAVCMAGGVSTSRLVENRSHYREQPIALGDFDHVVNNLRAVARGIALSVAKSESRLKTGVPVAISYATAPRENRSLLRSRRLP